MSFIRYQRVKTLYGKKAKDQSVELSFAVHCNDLDQASS